MKFLNTKCQDMTIGQTLVYVIICMGLSFIPFVGIAAYEKISERRATESEEN